MLHRDILQVDDEESDAFLLRTVFAEVGIVNPVHVATTAQQAMDFLASRRGSEPDRAGLPLPCLVLLDLKLPGKNGLDLLRWIREQPRLRHLVVIVMSSSALPSDVRTAYDLGANAFVEKPVSYDRTVEMARGLKTWWLEINQFAPE